MVYCFALYLLNEISNRRVFKVWEENVDFRDAPYFKKMKINLRNDAFNQSQFLKEDSSIHSKTSICTSKIW